MPGAMTVVYNVAAAERVERIGAHRMLAPSDGKRVDNHAGIDGRTADPRKLCVEKADVEIGIVGNQHRTVEKIDQFGGHLAKGRLSDEVGVADAVHRLRLGVN